MRSSAHHGEHRRINSRHGNTADMYVEQLRKVNTPDHIDKFRLTES